MLGTRKRFKSVGLAEGEVPPGPCPVGGGGRWCHGPGDEELQVVLQIAASSGGSGVEYWLACGAREKNHDIWLQDRGICNAIQPARKVCQRDSKAVLSSSEEQCPQQIHDPWVFGGLAGPCLNDGEVITMESYALPRQEVSPCECRSQNGK